VSYPLAVFAPIIGGRTETFIRRHMESLLPGGTVVVAGSCNGGYGAHWSVRCPLLALDQNNNGSLKGRFRRALAHRMGREENPRETAVRRFLQEHGVRVIMGEYLDWSNPWLSVAQSLGIRFFVHGHGYDISALLRQAKWRAEYLKYNQSGGVITISQLSQQRLLDLGLDSAKIHLLPYGVDVPADSLTRAEQGVVRCIAVGRMVAKKAPILALDAFRRAAEACPSLRLDYVGAGELLPAARQFLHAFQLQERVTLHGDKPSEAVQSLMQRADIFLQHSMTDPETGDEEGLPVAILEAMANSLPVVSTRHAGIPEAVMEGSTGFLVEEGDSAAMAERVVTLAREPDLRFRMGAAGWRRAKDCFSWDKQRKQLLRILGIDQSSSKN
jgi:colanic acid/amylovoran biosynthesis glycosyltransferase